jgi:hypothetical protein
MLPARFPVSEGSVLKRPMTLGTRTSPMHMCVEAPARRVYTTVSISPPTGFFASNGSMTSLTGRNGQDGISGGSRIPLLLV